MFGPAGKIKVWLWVMASCLVTFFMIHTNRSKEGFLELVRNWTGILTSDDYALYSTWPAELSQSCLAHISRAAKKLSQDPVAGIAKGACAYTRNCAAYQNHQRDAHRGRRACVNNDESGGPHQLVQSSERLPRYSCQAP